MSRLSFKKGISSRYPKRWYLVYHNSGPIAYSYTTAKTVARIIDKKYKFNAKVQQSKLDASYHVYVSFRSNTDEAYFIMLVDSRIYL